MFVRENKLKTASDKYDDLNLWNKCKGCQKLVLKKDLASSNNVCPLCGFHGHLSIEKRFKLIFDEYSLLEPIKTVDDPLNFTDLKDYKSRLKENREKTGLNEAIQFAVGKMSTNENENFDEGAHGSVNGCARGDDISNDIYGLSGDKKKNFVNAIVGVMDFSFVGGSLSFFVGESIVNAATIALEKELPLVIFTASGGARMQEGIVSLMQMPRTILALKKLKQKKLPYINVLTNPTTGGVTASFAMIGNLTIAEPRATIGLAGVRVIEQTLREKIPSEFQTSEFCFKHGFIDLILFRNDIKSKLYEILKVFELNRNLS